MTTLFDASQWLLYFPEKMDTTRALWFVRDVSELDAWPDNAVALASGADFDNFRDCMPFFSQFPSVFVAISWQFLYLFCYREKTLLGAIQQLGNC